MHDGATHMLKQQKRPNKNPFIHLQLSVTFKVPVHEHPLWQHIAGVARSRLVCRYAGSFVGERVCMPGGAIQPATGVVGGGEEF